ncbi:MAG: GDSL-type esterase/lipase family protein [Planctomycetaceae bacterium]
MSLTRRELIGTAIGGAALAATGGLPRPALGQAAAARPPGHVVLLGDSIFDNKRFVGRGRAIVDQLGDALPAGWKATLLAAANMPVRQMLRQQVQRIPQDATCLVLCAGGVNAILGLINVRPSPNPLQQLKQDRDGFERDYGALVAGLIATKKSLVLCTIPAPDFANPNLGNIAVVGELGLPLFNDVVTKTAVANGLPLLDLRLVVQGKPDHAADGLHLSPAGGKKVAERLARIVLEHDFAHPQSVAYF